ncbi:MAG: hypothetical protein MZU95_07265 [Desulfomicrobium escambiense]|nr:hypothetical protein [Desulfomicrobium escambiense]
MALPVLLTLVPGRRDSRSRSGSSWSSWPRSISAVDRAPRTAAHGQGDQPVAAPRPVLALLRGLALGHSGPGPGRARS